MDDAFTLMIAAIAIALILGLDALWASRSSRRR